MGQDPDEDRIRRKAHELWQAEGHPHGRDQDHWDLAREIIAIEDSQRSTLLPRTSGADEPVESRQAAENYGDLPNLTDQGEHPLTDISREPALTSQAPDATAKAAVKAVRKPAGKSATTSQPEEVTPVARPASNPVTRNTPAAALAANVDKTPKRKSPSSGKPS